MKLLKTNYPLCGMCGKTSSGKTTVKCGVDCVKAIDIYTLVDDESPKPGQSKSFNIFDLLDGYELPDGFEVKKKSYDGRGIRAATVYANGDVDVTMQNVYEEGVSYRLTYRICEIDGNRSDTACVYIQMRSCCDSDELGCCNPMTGDVTLVEDAFVQGACGSVLEYDISNWQFETMKAIGELPECVNNLTVSSDLNTLLVDLSGCAAGEIEIPFVAFYKGFPCEKTLTVSVLDMCQGVVFENGTCDPCTGKWVCTKGSEVDGSAGSAPTTTQSSEDGPWVYHNVVIDGVPANGGNSLADINPLMDGPEFTLQGDSNLIRDCRFDEQTGEFLFTEGCGVGVVTVTYEICLADENGEPTNVKDTGTIIINVDNPPGECAKCEDGVEVACPQSEILGIESFDTDVLETVTYEKGQFCLTAKCSDKLPVKAKVIVRVAECCGETLKEMEFDVPCPDDCMDCQEGCEPEPEPCNNNDKKDDMSDNKNNCGGGLIPHNPGPSDCPTPPTNNCTDTTWTPDPSRVCAGDAFTQTSNCGNTRPAVGTMDCTCVETVWSPCPTTVCEGKPFTQTSDCDTERPAVGTKKEYWSPDPSTKCAGESFEQESTCGNKRTAVGTMVEVWSPDLSKICNDTEVEQTSNCNNTRRMMGTRECTEPCSEEFFPKPEWVCKGKPFEASNECGDCMSMIGTKEVECPDPKNVPAGEPIYNECGEPCGIGTRPIDVIPSDPCRVSAKLLNPRCDGSDFVFDVVASGTGAGLRYRYAVGGTSAATGTWMPYAAGTSISASAVAGLPIWVEVADIDDATCNDCDVIYSTGCCVDWGVYDIVESCGPNGEHLATITANSGGTMEYRYESNTTPMTAWAPFTSGTVITIINDLSMLVEIRDTAHPEETCHLCLSANFAGVCEDPTCEITNAAGVVECKASGQLGITVTYDTVDSAAQEFSIPAHPDLATWVPLTSGETISYPAPTTAGDPIVICIRDTANTDCKVELTVSAVDCAEHPVECEIIEGSGVAECKGPGQLGILLTYTANGSANQEFSIPGHPDLTGWVPVTSGESVSYPAPTTAGDEIVIVVRDAENPECLLEITVVLVDCGEHP